MQIEDRTAPIFIWLSVPWSFWLKSGEKLILGECEMMIDGMPHEDYGCLDCGYRWSKELLPATQITKIRYKVVENGPCTIRFQQSWCMIYLMEGVKYTYQGQNRKYQLRWKKVSEKKVYRLVCSLQKIIGAPLWEKNDVEGQVCDSCSFNLQITYADKRKRNNKWWCCRRYVWFHIGEICLQYLWKTIYNDKSNKCSYIKIIALRWDYISQSNTIRLVHFSLDWPQY